MNAVTTTPTSVVEAIRVEAPWKGLGQDIAEGDTIEQAMIKAGADFHVKRSPVWYEDTDKHGAAIAIEHPRRDVLYRSDTRAPLGICAKGYEVFQPQDVFEFFADVATQGGFKIDTAGTMAGGAKVWALSKVGDVAFVTESDPAAQYLLLVTSFDQSMATTGAFLSMRFACLNVLNSSRVGLKVRVPHNVKDAKAKLQKQLGVGRSAWDEWLNNAREMADRNLTGADVDDFLLSLMKNPGATSKMDDEIRLSKPYQRAVELFEGEAIGSDLGAPRTAWKLLNAITEMVDHHGAGKSADGKLQSAWLGKGDAMKTRAYELLTA